jgi:putative tryptophan/tyrosine transport system substrate-binding protein
MFAASGSSAMSINRTSRRELMGALGGAVVWPAFACAQERTRRIGILMNFAAGDKVAEARVSKFLEALDQRGWTQGRNIQIETRWTDGITERIRKDAAELVALSPDLILATTTPAVTALKRATSNIPVVFVSVVDPVGSGLAASMSRPGGNITGFVTFEYALAAKWLELLREMVPAVTRAAVLRDSSSATGIGLFAAIQTVVPIGLELSVIDSDDPDMEHQIATFAREPNGGLIVTPNQFTGNHPDVIVAAAARNRLPAIYPFRYFVDDGGLISYGSTLYEGYRGAAEYADRILKGERPAELPVQAPTSYELVVNLKSAKAFGLAVPQSLLTRADEVIE